jgi:hypothetical protein
MKRSKKEGILGDLSPLVKIWSNRLIAGKLRDPAELRNHILVAEAADAAMCQSTSPQICCG